MNRKIREVSFRRKVCDVIAKDVDDYVPTGGSAHQDILDQMAAEIAGTRPALLDLELYDALFEVKGFRHLVSHKHGFDLKPDKVVTNLELLESAFPAFIDAVIQLERAMRSGDDPDGENGETFSAILRRMS
ncbi:hypothetical protein ATY76_14280 [Rhizobium sp. R339]|nr:hypothetical protein ATY76_14280 [Rhizobium sp. R339]